MLVTLTGCVGDGSSKPGEQDIPVWATSLFADIDGLILIEADDAIVEFEFRGHASEMAQTMMGRLTQADDFMLHEQLAVTGKIDEGKVQVVWTPTEPDEAPGLADGKWNVDATLTIP